nr:hypothetical protein [uncultured archaeon]
MNLIKTNTATRLVLFEKTQPDERMKFYNSIIESQEDGLLNNYAIESLIKMTISEVCKKRNLIGGFINKDTFGNLIHSALEFSMKHFNKYRDDKNPEKCYKYFLTLINHNINANLQ